MSQALLQLDLTYNERIDLQKKNGGQINVCEEGNSSNYKNSVENKGCKPRVQSLKVHASSLQNACPCKKGGNSSVSSLSPTNKMSHSNYILNKANVFCNSG